MSGDPLDMVGMGHGWYGYNLVSQLRAWWKLNFTKFPYPGTEREQFVPGFSGGVHVSRVESPDPKTGVALRGAFDRLEYRANRDVTSLLRSPLERSGWTLALCATVLDGECVDPIGFARTTSRALGSTAT